MMIGYTKKEDGKIYLVVDVVTAEHNQNRYMYLYHPVDYPSRLFVMGIEEFKAKFERIPENEGYRYDA